jgi:pimeloyl-ACP methyl ester carboxylesterase
MFPGGPFLRGNDEESGVMTDMLDVHLGGKRPLGYEYWPLPEDDPGVELGREPIRTVAPDGGLARGILWTPPGGAWKTAIVMSHPRADFSVHYACPLLAAAGYAVCGFGTRYMNNDTDCVHEAAALDVKMMADEMRQRGAEAVVLVGNSGGGPLTALAQSIYGIGDGWVGLAASRGEGTFMTERIDPSVADEDDPFSTIPELDMYNPDNGWRPWPSPVHYDLEWLKVFRAAQMARLARIDAIAKESLRFSEDAAKAAAATDPSVDPAGWRRFKTRAVWNKYMVTYRTLADPAYLDLDIDPDDRPIGSLFAHPDPMVANYRRNGLARSMTARGWLSTWSGLSSHARMDQLMPQVTIPSLLLHPTADTEVRIRETEENFNNNGAQDKTIVHIKGAPHYLEGYRPESMAIVAEWLAKRFP